MYIERNSMVYLYTMLFLITLSPFLFYFWHRQGRNAHIAKKETLSTLVNVLLLGILGSFIIAKINFLVISAITPKSLELLINIEGQRLYGGIIFVCAYYIFFYKNGLDILNSLAITIAPLLAFGKLGCFLAGHTGCAGTLATNFVGCWYFDVEQNGYIYLIPKQLIDAAFYSCLFVYLIFKYRKNADHNYLAFYFILYTGIYLFIVGFWANESYIITPFRINQIYALLLLPLAFYTRRVAIKKVL